jgi:YidC/Oxa1 family membrane protein insertase
MTGIISFTVPAGLGLYWIVGNIYQIFQQLFMDKFIIKNNSNVEKRKDYNKNNGLSMRKVQDSENV